jgi:RimJ/RimL family protein N-acetyltransferase
MTIPEGFETERLWVRSPRPGDGAAVFEAVAESLADLRAWPASLPWAAQAPSPSASEAFCLSGHRAFREGTDLSMLVFAKSTGLLVGCVGLHQLHWVLASCEVGYWGRSSCRKQGFVTEALAGITQFAFTHLKMRRVACQIDANNLASRAVAERVGFVQERTECVPGAAPNGSSVSTCFYALSV